MEANYYRLTAEMFRCFIRAYELALEAVEYDNFNEDKESSRRHYRELIDTYVRIVQNYDSIVKCEEMKNTSEEAANV
jgi:hypothetical protein